MQLSEFPCWPATPPRVLAFCSKPMGAVHVFASGRVAWLRRRARPMGMRRQGWSAGGRQGWRGVWGIDGWSWGRGWDRVVLAAAVGLGGRMGRGGGLAASRRRWRRWIWRWRCWRRRVAAMCGQSSSQRSLQTRLRNASMGLTWARAQCMPLPLSRASTTSLLPLSTAPSPIGQDLSRRVCKWVRAE